MANVSVEQRAGNGAGNGHVLSTRPAHTNAGTPAGTYLRRYWQPVYIASKLASGWSVPIRILGENSTLYRGESGTPHLVGYRLVRTPPSWGIRLLKDSTADAAVALIPESP